MKSSFITKLLRKHPPSPKRVELIYLPFYHFIVNCRIEEKEQSVDICLDGLLGDNLFFLQENLQFQEQTDHSYCSFQLKHPEAEKIAFEKYRWKQMEHRFRMKQKFDILNINAGKQIYYPFWVGYFQNLRGYDFKLIDGVSGSSQEIRMRKLFLKALRLLEE